MLYGGKLFRAVRSLSGFSRCQEGIYGAEDHVDAETAFVRARNKGTRVGHASFQREEELGPVLSEWRSKLCLQRKVEKRGLSARVPRLQGSPEILSEIPHARAATRDAADAGANLTFS